MIKRQSSSVKITEHFSPVKHNNNDNSHANITYQDDSMMINGGQNQQIDEIQNMIRMQRQKVKFKFAVDDHSNMNNYIQTLMGTLSDYVIMKMIKKSHNRNLPGPLLEKRFLQNDKIQYYAKRYWPVKEKTHGVHNHSIHINMNQDNEEDEDEDSLDYNDRSQSVIGLKLKQPERRKPPRSRAYGPYPQNYNTQNNQSRNGKQGYKNGIHSLKVQIIDDTKDQSNIIVEQNNYMDMINTGNGNATQDQSTTLSTTGINIQSNNLGEISSNACSPIKGADQLNFWHSANPALNLMTNHVSPKKKVSQYQVQDPLQCSSPLGFNNDSEQFFVKRTSSRMNPNVNLVKGNTNEGNSSKHQENVLSSALLVQSQEVRTTNHGGLSGNLSLNHNEYLQKILSDIAHNSQGKQEYGTEQFPNTFKRPQSLFKSMPNAAAVNKQANLIGFQRQQRGAYVKIDRSIGKTSNGLRKHQQQNLLNQANSSQRNSDIFQANQIMATNSLSAQNNHSQFMKYVQHQQLLHRQQQQNLLNQQQQALHAQIQQSGQIPSNPTKKIGLQHQNSENVSWARQLQNNIFAQNLNQMSQGQLINHSNSFKNQPNSQLSSFASSNGGSQYDMISHKRDSNLGMVERNPLRSAILPTKVCLVMQQVPPAYQSNKQSKNHRAALY